MGTITDLSFIGPYSLSLIHICLISHGSGFVFREPGDAEIRHLNGAVLQKHDILRLYIPVDNPFFMGVLKRRLSHQTRAGGVWPPGTYVD